MPELSLHAKSPLAGISKQYEGVGLVEITDKALVSVAIPNGTQKDFGKAITDAYGAKVPDVGSSHMSDDGKLRILAMQIDQLFLLFDYTSDHAVGANC